MYVKLYEVEEEFNTDKIQIYVVEIPKYLMLENKENPSELDQWMWLFSGKKELMKMALSKGAQAIKKAYKELEYLSQDEQARQEYDEYVEAKFNNSMIMHFEREKEKIQIAKNMLKSNLSVEIIMKVTGLTEKEIKDIKQNLYVKNVINNTKIK